MKHPLYLIAAVDDRNGIGKKGQLPWHLPSDLRFFQETTEHTVDPLRENIVVMGRTTWESIPKNHRPLPGRHNIVLTRKRGLSIEGATIHHSLDAVLRTADETIEKIFVIGGGELFREAIVHPDVAGLYLTRVSGDFDCDTFFPLLSERFKNPQSLGKGEDDGNHFEFWLYTV